MKVTVCDFPDEASRKESAWDDLLEHVRKHAGDLVVLPEMNLHVAEDAKRSYPRDIEGAGVEETG